MEIKPLDYGLWSGEWRLDYGRAILGECQTTNSRRELHAAQHSGLFQITVISLLSWVIWHLWKNSGAQAWKCAAQTLYFSAHTEKNRGNIGPDRKTCRSTAARRIVARRATRECGQCHVVSVRSSRTQFCYFSTSFRTLVSALWAFLSSRHSSALYCFYCIL